MLLTLRPARHQRGKIRHKLVEKNQPAVKRWRNSPQEFVENNPESRVSDYRASTYEQMMSSFVDVEVWPTLSDGQGWSAHSGLVLVFCPRWRGVEQATGRLMEAVVKVKLSLLVELPSHMALSSGS